MADKPDIDDTTGKGCPPIPTDIPIAELRGLELREIEGGDPDLETQFECVTAREAELLDRAAAAATEEEAAAIFIGAGWPADRAREAAALMFGTGGRDLREDAGDASR